MYYFSRPGMFLYGYFMSPFQALGHALAMNKSTLELVLIDSTISEEGLRLLHKLKRPNILVLGTDKRFYLTNVNYQTEKIRFSLPEIKLTAE